MEALTISLIAGVALCGIMSTPASAMPISDLAAAASDLALGQSVRYVCNRYYGHYALRSEPGFYRRPYYGYYRGY